MKLIIFTVIIISLDYSHLLDSTNLGLMSFVFL
jgi:hypothetical protein